MVDGKCDWLVSPHHARFFAVMSNPSPADMKRTVNEYRIFQIPNHEIVLVDNMKLILRVQIPFDSGQRYSVGILGGIGSRETG